MYQRQAILISMWALYECELTNYYSHIASVLGRNTDLPKKGRMRISQFTHIINSFKHFGCLGEESENFTQATERLNGEVRLIRNAWAHNGGKLKNNDVVDGIDGVLISTGQVSLSVNYIKLVSELMALVTNELSDSVVEIVEHHKSAKSN